MFNHIRKVPYAQPDGKGGLNYFAGGFQNQFGLETQIVAAIYGVLSFATISLALKVPRIADQRAQQVAVLVWGGVILAVYSFLLSVFRIKNGGCEYFPEIIKRRRAFTDLCRRSILVATVLDTGRTSQESREFCGGGCEGRRTQKRRIVAYFSMYHYEKLNRLTYVTTCILDNLINRQQMDLNPRCTSRMVESFAVQLRARH